jgi:hypothetical protein
MPQVDRPICPKCQSLMILALPPGGKGQRTFQCLDCDRPDPLKSEKISGWLKGELGGTLRAQTEIAVARCYQCLGFSLPLSP